MEERNTRRQRALTRRQFMALSAAGVTGLLATACGSGSLPSPAATTGAQTTAAGTTQAAGTTAATTAAQTTAAGPQPTGAARPSQFK